MPDALDACTCVNDVNFVAFGDRGRGAFRLACAAIDAIFVDVKRQPNLQIFWILDFGFQIQELQEPSQFSNLGPEISNRN